MLLEFDNKERCVMNESCPCSECECVECSECIDCECECCSEPN